MFRKAERKKAKLRLALIGPSGAGKTYTALLLAKGLGGKTAVVDTENGSADLYSHLLDYDVATLDPPFEPQRYLSVLQEAENAGYETVVIDSLSHAWTGEGGMLDMQGKLAERSNGYAAWRHITPLHNKLVDWILRSKCHVITTLRTKQDYLQTEENGRKVIKKVGLAPVFRDGIEYEFTSVLELGMDHSCTASKDRTGIFDGRCFTPTADTSKELLAWLESGVEPPKIITFPELLAGWRANGMTDPEIGAMMKEKVGKTKPADLTREDLEILSA